MTEKNLVSECHEWSEVAISACLCCGPRGCICSECCPGGKPIATLHVNYSFTITHQHWAWDQTSTVFQISVMTQPVIKTSLPAFVAHAQPTIKWVTAKSW